MKMRNEGLMWGLIVGIPALFMCLVGIAALLVRWDSLAKSCERYVAQALNKKEEAPK